MLPESALLNYSEAYFKGFGIKYPLIYVSGRPQGHPEKEVVMKFTSSLHHSCTYYNNTDPRLVKVFDSNPSTLGLVSRLRHLNR